MGLGLKVALWSEVGVVVASGLGYFLLPADRAVYAVIGLAAAVIAMGITIMIARQKGQGE